MSEDDRDIDVESADDVPDIGMEATASCQSPPLSIEDNSTVDKRAHHNLLERRRRDHIKDSFHDLRDCIPSLQGEKVSRAHILNKATEYIRQLQKGGSIREGEIDDLELKNEVLEEQVNALEQAKAQGSSQDAEDILQSVAERVCTRQKMLEKQQKQAKEQAQTKSERSGEGAREGRKATADHLAGEGRRPRSAMAASGANLENKTTAKGPGDGSGSQLLSNSLNLLHVASNIKNAQTLLSTLQKNLPPNTSLPANIKSLAARVLASPLRAQGAGPTSAHPLPRGVVTATTVPKGSPLTTNLAAALQQQQQKQQQASGLNISPRTLSSQIKPTIVSIPSTRTGHSVSSSNAATINTDQGPPTSSSSQPSAPDSSQSITLSESVSPLSSVSMGAFPSQPTQISASLLTQATNLSSQILAANSLHNATGRENFSSPTAVTPKTSQDLLAQVSSFLNLPNPAVIKPSEHEGLNSGLIHSALVPEVEPLADSGEGLALDVNAECAAKGGDIVSTSGTDEPAVPQQSGDGTKRPASDSDSNPLPKKPRMDL